MKTLLPLLLLIIIAVSCGTSENLELVVEYYAADIPLPEHPRPDWERPSWINLNGQWGFASDPDDMGERSYWFAAELDSVFDQAITVPFSWASPLSGIGRSSFHFGWYMREIMVPRGGDWTGKRYWLVIGASDFTTTLWVNGELVGEHEGGYTPIEFDITDYLSGGTLDRLVLRCEDLGLYDRPVGNQSYGDAKGIWQTVYLEGRSPQHFDYVHFSPDIDSSLVAVTVKLAEKPDEDLIFSMAFEDEMVETAVETIPAGIDSIVFDIPIPDMRLWTLNDPFLYNVNVGLDSAEDVLDRVYTYFGMRKIDVLPLPENGEMYVALNNRPIYLKMALDRSYHPEGFYTFPTDEYMQDEIIRAKQLGLDGIRIHAKTDIPRKLYWADRHGLLIMADVPGWEGDIDEDAQRYWTHTAEQQIMRDFNHPSIFAWTLFSESKSIFTVNINGVEIYLPQSQEWVREQYRWAKSLDPTRLVDDNATSRGWHVETDLNSMHAYLPGGEWADYLDEASANTTPGSGWNFIGDNTQTDLPLFIAESGAVNGYAGGTGDIDITYQYHVMMNELRRRPKIAGFVFTQLHDVINEWNGYYRYDRTPKEFGLDDLCSGMTMADFHRELYLIPGDGFDRIVSPGETFRMPVTASFMAAVRPVRLTVETRLHGWDRFGQHKEYGTGEFPVNTRPYGTFTLPPVTVTAPSEECLAVWTTTLKDPSGTVLHRNFVPFRVEAPDLSTVVTSTVAGSSAEPAPVDTTGVPRPAQLTFKQVRTRIEGATAGDIVMRQHPIDFADANWSVNTAAVLDSMKVWGTGEGWFEYVFPVPEELDPADIAAVQFIAELSSRHMQAKDQPPESLPSTAASINPGFSPNSFPQTDRYVHPAALRISLNERNIYDIGLDDDPADHRGLLSWINQPSYERSWFLHEAGSYGYLVTVTFGEEGARAAAESGEFRIRLAVPEATDSSGGLSVFGEEFGRYPVGPTLVIRRK